MNLPPRPTTSPTPLQDAQTMHVAAWIEAGRAVANVNIVKNLKLHRYTLACMDCANNDMISCLRTQVVHYIYVESTAQPSIFTLRQLISSCLGLVSPITIHCGPHFSNLKKMFQPLYHIHFSAQNCTDIKFVNELLEQRSFWKTKLDFQTLQTIRSHLLAGNKKSALKMLYPLLNIEHMALNGGLCMSLLLQEIGEYQAAEKILLALFKKNHLDCSVILALSYLYLNLSSPSTALDLLNSAIKNAPDPTIYLLDVCQALIMLDRLDECITQLKKLHEKNFAPQFLKNVMPRVYFAAGIQHRFEEIVENSLAEVNRYNAGWRK